MATVERFEDLLCWKKARELTAEVYKAFKGNTDRGFTDQVQRAAVSVMSNISEGFESGTREMFVNYLYIAKGSAGEVRSQLYAAHDIKYLNIQTFEHLKTKAEEVSKLLNTFIRAVKSSPHRGLQRRKELTKSEREQQEFMEDARRQLAKVHPHIYGKKGIDF